MKTFKIFSVIVGCLLAISFTSSCSSDDDNPTLTPAQVQAALTTIKGDYQGKMTFVNLNANTSSEGITETQVSATFNTDSTLVIKNFPSTAIANMVTDSVISAQIAQLPAMDLPCAIGVYQNAPISFLINPAPLSFKFNLKNTDHNVKVGFYINTAMSFGFYSQNTGVMSMQLVIADIFVDGNPVLVSYPQVFPITFSLQRPKAGA